MKHHIKLISFLFIFFPFFLSAQTAKELFEGKVNPNLLSKDVDAVYQELNKNHPNLYLFIDKKKLTKKFDSLKHTLNEPITRLEFRYKLLTVLQSIGDGHLSLIMDASSIHKQDYDGYFGKRFLPIQQFTYKVIDTNLFLTASWYHTDLTIGDKVMAINGIPARQVIEKMCNGICADGFNNAFKYFTLNANVFQNVYSSTFGYQDSIVFQIKKNGVEKSVLVTTISSSQITPASLTKPNSTFSISNDRKYATLKINSFDKNLSFGFQAGYQNWFVDLMRADSKILILDLRDNVGGDQTNATNLFSFLINEPAYFGTVPKEFLNKAKKISPNSISSGIETKITPSKSAFNGKIYLLINGGSFSAAAIFAANLQSLNKKIIVVGQESGGGRDGCTGGTFKYLSLKNSTLTLNYGEVPLKTLGNSPFKGRGILPDINIKYTIEDYLSKRDLETDWVIKDIYTKL
ncbi:C-terminal processing protease CtpA/Prc [Pedobacter sp. UYP24]